MPTKMISIYLSDKMYKLYLEDPDRYNDIGRNAIKRALENSEVEENES